MRSSPVIALAVTVLCLSPELFAQPSGVRNVEVDQTLIDDTREAGTKRPATIKLFNGKDLSNWTWHSREEGSPVEKTWSVEDGLLVCQGKPAGYIRTKSDDYEDYRLIVEWRWPEGTRGGNNGVLIHTTTPAALGIWPRSLEVQLAHQNAGDFWVIGTTVEIPRPEGRIKDRRHLNLTDDSEKPIGEWNTMEIVARGDTVTVKVNGELVNEATNLSQSQGAICLQSEGAPIQFRKVELTPLEAEKP
jgi:Domain of Unknown Function (DUF1080)